MTAMVLLSAWQASQVEFWRPIKGQPDYDVSSFGRIRSHRKGRPIIITSYVNNNGYRTARFKRNGKVQRAGLHRLVLSAFSEDTQGKRGINHRNGIKDDARLPNLEWATQQENVTHCYTFLNPRILRGEEIGDSKFKESDIRQMRQWFAEGLSQSEIGRRFKVPQGTIWRIVVKPYQAWKHVD